MDHGVRDQAVEAEPFLDLDRAAAAELDHQPRCRPDWRVLKRKGEALRLRGLDHVESAFTHPPGLDPIGEFDLGLGQRRTSAVPPGYPTKSLSGYRGLASARMDRYEKHDRHGIHS